MSDKEKLKVQQVAIELIDAKNDRDIGDITGLQQSIAEDGLLQPIVVVRKEKDRFDIVAGRRRLMAIKKLKWTAVTAVVLDDADHVDAQTLAENIHRKDLSPVEKMQRLVGWMVANGMESPTEMGTIWIEDPVLDKMCTTFEIPTHGEVLRTINLALVAKPIQDLVHTGKITLGAALLTLGKSDKMIANVVKGVAKRKGIIYGTAMLDLMDNEVAARMENVALPSDEQCKECPWRNPAEDLFEEGVEPYDERGDFCYNLKCAEKKAKETAKIIAEAGATLGVPRASIGNNTANKLQRANIKAFKNEDKCKTCDDVTLVQGKDGEFVAYCNSWCDNIKKNEANRGAAEKSKDETKARAKELKAKALNPEAKLTKTEEKELTETLQENVDKALGLAARRFAVTRFAELQAREINGDQFGAFNGAERVLFFVMYNRNPADMIGHADGPDGYEEAREKKALAMLGHDIRALAMQIYADCSPMFERRVDFAGVAWKEIEYQWELATGEKNFLAMYAGPIIDNLNKSAKANYDVICTKGFVMPWARKEEKPKAAKKKSKVKEDPADDEGDGGESDE